jgi:hypothetical protein
MRNTKFTRPPHGQQERPPPQRGIDAHLSNGSNSCQNHRYPKQQISTSPSSM